MTNEVREKMLKPSPPSPPIAGPVSKKYFEEYDKLFKERPPEERLSGYILAKAEGSWLIDVDGNKYIDMTTQWATNNCGACHPRVLEAAIRALRQYGLIIGSYGECEPRFELARKLQKIMPPNVNRVTWEVSGTEASEGSVQHILVSKKRPLIISFIRQYAGMSIGAKNISCLGASLRRHLEAMHGGVLWAPYPISYRIPCGLSQDEYADWILYDFIEEELLKYVADPSSIAGVYFEPMMAEGGHWVPPKNFIQGLRKLADKYDWLLDCDEVLVGFGRTGKWWGIENYSVPVDIVPVAKGISGGIIPMGAIFGRQETLLGHSGGTFAGQPAACAACIEFINIVEEEKLLPRVARNGERALKRMKEWVDEYKIVGDARGIGYLLAVEIITDKKTEKADITGAGKIAFEMQRNGVVPVWDPYVPVVRFMPALTIEDELLNKALDVCEEAIKKAQRGQL